MHLHLYAQHGERPLRSAAHDRSADEQGVDDQIHSFHDPCTFDCQADRSPGT